MSTFLKNYEFKFPLSKIEYLNEKEPLKLNENFCFYHNKSRFRKDLNKLQYLFAEYLKTPLVAAGIRDSYLREDISENYFIILFTTGEIVKMATEILEEVINFEIKPDHFLLINTEDYMLLATKNLDLLSKGIDVMHEILKQTLDDYIKQKKYDEFIKIGQFRIYSS